MKTIRFNLCLLALASALLTNLPQQVLAQSQQDISATSAAKTRIINRDTSYFMDNFRSLSSWDQGTQSTLVKKMINIIYRTRNIKSPSNTDTAIYVSGMRLSDYEDIVLGTDPYSGQTVYGGLTQSSRLMGRDGYNYDFNIHFDVSFSFTSWSDIAAKNIFHYDYHQDKFSDQMCVVGIQGSENYRLLDWPRDYPLTIPQTYLALQTLEFIQRAYYFLGGHMPSINQLQDAFEQIYSYNYTDINKINLAEIDFLKNLIKNGIVTCARENMPVYNNTLEQMHNLLLSAFPQLDFNAVNPKFLKDNIALSNENFLTAIANNLLPESAKNFLATMSAKDGLNLDVSSIAGTAPVVPPAAFVIATNSNLNVKWGDSLTFTAQNGNGEVFWFFNSPSNAEGNLSCDQGAASSTCTFVVQQDTPPGAYKVFAKDSKNNISSNKITVNITGVVAPPIPPVQPPAKPAFAISTNSNLTVKSGDELTFNAVNGSGQINWWYSDPANNKGAIACNAGTASTSCAFRIPNGTPPGVYKVFAVDSANISSTNQIAVTVVSAVLPPPVVTPSPLPNPTPVPPVTPPTPEVPVSLEIKKSDSKTIVVVSDLSKFENMVWIDYYTIPFTGQNRTCQFSSKDPGTVTMSEISSSCQTAFSISIEFTARIKGTNKTVTSNRIKF